MDGQPRVLDVAKMMGTTKVVAAAEVCLVVKVVEAEVSIAVSLLCMFAIF